MTFFRLNQQNEMSLIFNCEHPQFIAGVPRACGQCPSCRRRQTLQWSLRGYHEQLTSYQNKLTFFTLTYSDEYLHIHPETRAISPTDCRGSLDFRDTTLFIKRLRKYLSKHYPDRKLRYMYCGEYGSPDKTFRPHYHFICFNFDETEVSPKLLKQLWPFGHIHQDKKSLTDNFEIQYVTGYTRKKLSKQDGSWETYEGNYRQRPKMITSQGIGKAYAMQHLEAISKAKYIPMSTGKKQIKAPVPRYYQKLIIRQEGIHLKFHQFISDDDFNGKNYKYSYKTFPNPDGPMTKNLDKNLRESYIYQFTQLKEIAPIKEVNQLLRAVHGHYFQTKKLQKEEYEFANFHKKNLELTGGTSIELISTHIAQKRAPWKKRYTHYPGWMPQLAELAQKSARQKNDELRSSKYGQRDKVA